MRTSTPSLRFVAALWALLASACGSTDSRFTAQPDSGVTQDIGGITCTDPQSQCGQVCVSLASDPTNCGACAFACASDQMCVNGRCLGACPTGETRCGQSCVDFQTDRTNCGACDHACAAGLVCSQGSCTVSCGAMYARCDLQNDAGVATGAACTDTRSDERNCGGCGLR